MQPAQGQKYWGGAMIASALSMPPNIQYNYCIHRLTFVRGIRTYGIEEDVCGLPENTVPFSVRD
jgi:hypothetical protein